MNRDNLNAKQRAALDVVENFIFYFTSDEAERERMGEVAYQYVEQDHVLTSEEDNT